MKKCKLCGRAMSPSSKAPVCRSCRQKIGAFAKKSIAGAAVAAGAAVTAVVVKKRSEEAAEAERFKGIDVAKGAGAVRDAGKRVLEEGRETLNLAGSFIEEHTMGARDMIEKGIEIAELKLKGLPAAYAREEHPFILKKIRDRYDSWRDDRDSAEEEIVKNMLEED